MEYISCVPLSFVADISHMQRDIDAGWIDVREHPNDHHLVILCYTRKTQSNGHWVKDTTMVARGLILYCPQIGSLNDARIIGRGIPKFFTIETIESEDDWGKIKLIDDDENVTVENDVQIPFEASAFISDKLDGALGVGYPYGGTFQVATKGSFASDEAIIANKIMNTRVTGSNFTKGETLFTEFDQADILYDYTPIFEIITPNLLPFQKHVIDYGNIENLFLLGIVCNSDGHYHPVQELMTDEQFEHTVLSRLAEICEFGIPETMHYDNLVEALSAPEIANKEGMVTVINDNDQQYIYKIKYPTFLRKQAIHHMTKAGRKEILNHIDPYLCITDYKQAVAKAVDDSFPDLEEPAWKELMCNRFLELTEDEYFKPLLDTWDKLNDKMKELEVTTYAPFDDPVNKKDYAMMLHRLNDEGKLTPTEYSALFAVPKCIYKDAFVNIPTLAEHFCRIANRSLKI